MASQLPKISLLVNLFEPSTGPKYGLRAAELADLGMSPTEVGLALGFERRVAKHRAQAAIAYGRKMQAAGLTDPFLELTKAPAAASRWRTHARFRPTSPESSDGDAA